MDSQESPPVHHPPQPPTHLQSSPHHHHYQQTPHGTMVAPPPQPQPPHHQPQQQPHHQQPNSYTVPNNNNLNIPTHNNNIQQQQQQQNPQQFGFNSGPKPNLDFTDGSSVGPTGPTTGLSIEPSSAGKKRRGRPRKYSPDGNIALGLSPAPPVTPISSTVSAAAAAAAAAGNGAASSENPSKKARGRPPGSSNKKQEALGAVGVGFGFTPHLITVSAGEDIASKVMTFSQQGPRAVCILSANGAVSNVTLRQSAMSGGTVTYEGRFEIISLSGSFLLSESNGSRSRTGGLSVSLSGPDGRVLGGGVAGMLMAATPVQVVVGSFIADGKKPKSQAPPVAPPSNMLNFGVPGAEASSPSQGASSDSSDENGGSPLSHGPGPFGNTTQPMHGMPMYWSGQTM